MLHPKPLILALGLLFVLQSTFAQFHPITPRKPAPVDSAKYYEKQINQLWRNAIDSFRNSPAYLQALENYKRLRPISNSYSSFVLFTEAARADYSHLNSAIAASGFPALKGPVWRIGFGFSGETRSRLVFDFWFASIGLSNTAKSNDQTVRSTFSDLLQFNMGYDILKSTRFNLYPYAGISGRLATLTYSKSSVANPNYTSIIDIIQNSQSVNASSTRLGYQAGLGFDCVLGENEKSHGGTMLFIKAGTNGAFGTESFNISGLNYKPDIRQGAWIFTIGFKFFGRE